MGVKSLCSQQGQEARPRYGVIGATVNIMVQRILAVSSLRKDEQMLRYTSPMSTVAVDQAAIRPLAIFIPTGTILNVSVDAANCRRFAEVDWDLKSIHVFAVDLRDRGELIKAQST